jgi:hypothetical protein
VQVFFLRQDLAALAPLPLLDARKGVNEIVQTLGFHAEIEVRTAHLGGWNGFLGGAEYEWHE